eukprot:UN28205
MGLALIGAVYHFDMKTTFLDIEGKESVSVKDLKQRLFDGYMQLISQRKNLFVTLSAVSVFMMHELSLKEPDEKLIRNGILRIAHCAEIDDAKEATYAVQVLRSLSACTKN